MYIPRICKLYTRQEYRNQREKVRLKRLMKHAQFVLVGEIAEPVLDAETARRMLPAEAFSMGRGIAYGPGITHFLCSQGCLSAISVSGAILTQNNAEVETLQLQDFLVYPPGTAFFSTYFTGGRRGDQLLVVLSSISAVTPDDRDYETDAPHGEML